MADSFGSEQLGKTQLYSTLVKRTKQSEAAGTEKKRISKEAYVM